MQFYQCVDSDVMLNYASDDVMITVARGFLFVTILMHYPVLLHPTRANINGYVCVCSHIRAKALLLHQGFYRGRELSFFTLPLSELISRILF